MNWVRKFNDGVMATTRPSTRQLVVYLSFLLAMYLVTLPFKAMNVMTSVTYYILDGHYEFGNALFPLYTIAEIVAFGPVMSLVMLSCFRKSVVNWTSTGMMPPRKEHVLGLLLVLSIALLNAGLVTNRLFNIASAQAKAFFDATGSGWENYAFAYFLDEIVGHHLMNAGFVLFYAVMALVMPRDSTSFSRPVHVLNGGERVLVLVVSLVYGIIFSIENLEGQSMVFTAVVMGCITTLIVLGITARKNRLSLANRPFLLFTMILLGVMVVFTLVWGLALGVKPWYPFFYEPSELQSLLMIP